MASQIYWVKPTEPQSIRTKPDISLQPSDLIPDWMDFVWVFPGALDVPKLCDALARTLQDFYHASGRLSLDDSTGRWAISFSENDGVPITVGTTALPSIMSADFNHQKHSDYVNEHPYMLNPDPMALGKQPFITLKVVTNTSTGETTLTLGWCHICGDCASMTHLMNSLSLCYQDIAATFKPSFDKYHQSDPVLDEELIPQVLPLLYYQEHAMETSIVLKSLETMLSTTSRIAVRISADQVRAIHAWVTKRTTVPRVSETDAVVGFFSTAIAAVSPAPVRRIAYILGTRSGRPVPESDFTAPSLTSMGNCMQTITTEEVTQDAAPWNFADAMRTSMNYVRDPENLRRILALNSQMLQRPGLVGDYLNLTSPDTMVYINALNKIPMLKAHFGYVDRTRFYLYGSSEHFVSMLPANPTKGISDGEWVADAGGIDVVFRLKHARVPGFWKELDEMMQAVSSK
ncbi:hypothetical protein FIBSPDRAFT_1038589 [Athelia psychrophila]|uniref:Uncharacterized protein n=1 Tax=Athelia psychrophila TaxID=1759441 RepID=A0A166SV37_9AGAM|nr:hypothetical protein FIBSPDRAFT_1038589 [Fibularhizoctonia sp. CBS 109695]